MKALSQDYNWLKVIGIIVILSATMLLYRCSRGFTQRAQVNAPLLVQSVCRSQIHTYERTGHFIENIAGQGDFPNPYPEFYTHLTQYEANQAFHYATSRSPYLKSYVGLVVGSTRTVQAAAQASAKAGAAISQKQHSAIAIVCEATKPGATPATNPGLDASTLDCGSQTRQVGDLLSSQ